MSSSSGTSDSGLENCCSIDPATFRVVRTNSGNVKLRAAIVPMRVFGGVACGGSREIISADSTSGGTGRENSSTDPLAVGADPIRENASAGRNDPDAGGISSSGRARELDNCPRVTSSESGSSGRSLDPSDVVESPPIIWPPAGRKVAPTDDSPVGGKSSLGGRRLNSGPSDGISDSCEDGKDPPVGGDRPRGMRDPFGSKPTSALPGVISDALEVVGPSPDDGGEEDLFGIPFVPWIRPPAAGLSDPLAKGAFPPVGRDFPSGAAAGDRPDTFGRGEWPRGLKDSFGGRLPSKLGPPEVACPEESDPVGMPDIDGTCDPPLGAKGAPLIPGLPKKGVSDDSGVGPPKVNSDSLEEGNIGVRPPGSKPVAPSTGTNSPVLVTFKVGKVLSDPGSPLSSVDIFPLGDRAAAPPARNDQPRETNVPCSVPPISWDEPVGIPDSIEFMNPPVGIDPVCPFDQPCGRKGETCGRGTLTSSKLGPPEGISDSPELGTLPVGRDPTFADSDPIGVPPSTPGVIADPLVVPSFVNNGSSGPPNGIPVTLGMPLTSVSNPDVTSAETGNSGDSRGGSFDLPFFPLPAFEVDPENPTTADAFESPRGEKAPREENSILGVPIPLTADPSGEPRDDRRGLVFFDKGFLSFSSESLGSACIVTA